MYSSGCSVNGEVISANEPTALRVFSLSLALQAATGSLPSAEDLASDGVSTVLGLSRSWMSWRAASSSLENSASLFFEDSWLGLNDSGRNVKSGTERISIN